MAVEVAGGRMGVVEEVPHAAEDGDIGRIGSLGWVFVVFESFDESSQ
jgi:hypothetical protein